MCLGTRACITWLSERKYYQWTLHVEHSTKFTKKNERFLHWRVLAQCNSEYNLSSFEFEFPVSTISFQVTDSGNWALSISNGTEFLFHVITSAKFQVAGNMRGGRWRAEFHEIETTLAGNIVEFCKTYFHFHEIEEFGHYAGCGGTLDESTQQFTSLGYPFGYPAGSYGCNWVIQVEDGYTIVMNFTDFDTDSYKFTVIKKIDIRYSK